ncbi:uncharacterized protein LOC129611751 isoform X2 [Condylostylus longicornis]|nr:uncharacterized protein LOC129611751 isoform X2 [Condylostylus longicornis]XP_055381027.1 uncharacterized protein LOC129611751 isoform X2 [Condylostylus longicornis]
MPFNRFLPPEYGDGIDAVRASVEGGALSSARFVSLLVHGAREGNAPVTLILAQWGQLIDHDLTSTAQPRSINGSIPRCCGPNDFHPSCFPIKVPLDDPWLAPLKVRCLEFLRSAPAQRRDCLMSWREQTNQVTSFLDASPIYSSNARNSDSARVFRNGLLQFGRGGNPIDDNCNKGGFSPNCIKSGDPRSNEQPGLLALHHVWVGEHNRIANDLSLINLHWSDEKVYQETRRIIGALFQHITYREFLPLILGREVCRLFDLDLLNSGYYTGYDPHINPSIANSFSAAAFRFGHSLIPNSYIRCDQGHNLIQNNVSLHDEFAHGDMGTRGSLHRLIRGMVNQRALQRDEFITPELTNHLFQTGNFPFGLDLAAINIQRGRDHGIPPYTTWREPCGLTPITDWEDLNQVVGPESVRRMRHAYISVHDIDLFVGGIAERAVIGGLVGPTFACIIAQQFSNLRRGDRFWYENGGFENSFTPAQLQSIRRVTLAQILCRATGGGTYQPHIFIPHEADNNQRLPCGIPPLLPIDLRPWKELDPFKNTGTDIPFTFTHGTTDLPISIPHNKETNIKDVLTLTDDTLPSVQTLSTKERNEKDPKTTNVLLNRIDFVPNGSTGFRKPPPEELLQSQINDKLDFTNNITTTKRTPLINVQIIDHKLDTKKKKSTTTATTISSIKHITTKRKAFINNVPIEIGRTANAGLKSKKRVQEDSKHNDTVKDKTSMAKTGKTMNDEINVNEKTKTTTVLLKNKTDEKKQNSKLEQTKDNHKNLDQLDRVDKKENDMLTFEDNKEMMETDESNNRASFVNDYKTKQILCRTLKINSTKNTKPMNTNCVYEKSNDQNMTTKQETDQLNFNLDPTINEPIKQADLRTIHLNNNGNKNFVRKQNINIITATDGPNQEYEIEINIRKTNKHQNSLFNNVQGNRKTTTIQTENNFDGLHIQQHIQNDSPFSYKPPGQIVPISQYNNIHTNIPSIQTTKPPKIYYVPDEDDPFNRPENTTPRPGFFDNLLPSITGTFNGFFNSIQNFNSNSVTNTEKNEIIVTPPNRRVDMTPSTTTGTLISGLVHNNINQDGTVFFQPVLPNNGQFDSNTNKRPTYTNFNVQNYNPVLQPNRPIEISNNEWNNYINSPLIQSTTPFSQTNSYPPTIKIPYNDRPSNYRPLLYTNKPHLQIYIQNLNERQPYYRNHYTDSKIEHKNTDIKLDPTKKSIFELKSSNIETTTFSKEEIILEKPNTNFQMTTLDNDDTDLKKKDKEDNEYYDNEDDDISTERKINKQFDEDGYLRPEHTYLNLATEQNTFKNETLTKSTLNDNFVMPVLLTKTYELKTSTEQSKRPLLIDTIPRSPLTDIKAETEKTLIERYQNGLIEPKSKISSSTNFLFNGKNTTENPPLPVLPELRANEQSANEFPKPINTSIWQKHFTLQIF